MTHYTFTLVNWDINSIQYPKILPLIQKCHSNITIHELLLIFGSATLSAIIHQIHDINTQIHSKYCPKNNSQWTALDRLSII